MPPYALRLQLCGVSSQGLSTPVIVDVEADPYVSRRNGKYLDEKRRLEDRS